MKQKLKYLALISSALALSPISVHAAEQSACYVQFRYIAGSIKDGTFEASSRELWRVDKSKMRLQEAPDPSAGIHGLIISTSPDSWIINLFSKDAKHVIDKGSSTDIHAPLLPPALNSKLDGLLEFCHELTFFKKHQQDVLPQATIDGVSTTGLLIKAGNEQVALRQRKDGKPFQIEFTLDGQQIAVRYDRYENSIPVPADWFLPPKGLKITEMSQ